MTEARTQWPDDRINDSIGALRKAIDEQRLDATREHSATTEAMKYLAEAVHALTTQVAVLTERTEAATRAAASAAEKAEAAAKAGQSSGIELSKAMLGIVGVIVVALISASATIAAAVL